MNVFEVIAIAWITIGLLWALKIAIDSIAHRFEISRAGLIVGLAFYLILAAATGPCIALLVKADGDR